MLSLHQWIGSATGLALLLAGPLGGAWAQSTTAQPSAVAGDAAAADRDPARLLLRLYPEFQSFQQSAETGKALSSVARPAMPATLTPAGQDASTTHPAAAQAPHTSATLAVAWETIPSVQLELPSPEALVRPLGMPPASAAPLSPVASDPKVQVVLPAPSGADATVHPDVVDVNRAGAEELAQKLKIDARRARFIIEFRQAYGSFKRPEDLTQVYGITDEMLRVWEERGSIALDESR